MSTVKWRLASFADSIAFGCITKLKRNEYGIEKSHHNDAFVIAGGSNKGQRRIKTKRYPYRQGDLIMFEDRTFSVIGMQNKGKGVKIANYPGVKNKVVKPSKITSIQKRGGLCYSA